MTSRRRGTLELALAVTAAVGSALTWFQSYRPVTVAPIADGQPETVSVVYDPQLLLLTMLLVTAAGILAVVGTARIRRAARAGKRPDTHALPAPR